MFEIMFNDLKPEAQKRFLEYMGLKDASEGNYELVPIATIDYNDDDGEEDANESICLKEGDYEEDTDGCLLVKGFDFFFDELVDISFEGNPNHYTRYIVRADKGRFGKTILEPTGYEYDEENEDETVTSREVDCPCDCSDCEHADKCTENGRYDFEKNNDNIYKGPKLIVAPGDIEVSEDDKDHAILLHNCFLEVPAYRWYSAEKVYLSFVGDMDEVLGRPYAMIECWDVEEQYDNGNLGIRRHKPI